MNASPAILERARSAAPAAATSAPAWPMISVITPSFNQGRFIERCIRSVQAQDYPNCEHIVYDNCSTDATVAVLRRYPHVDWVSEPDRGQSDALNKALGKARRDHRLAQCRRLLPAGCV